MARSKVIEFPNNDAVDNDDSKDFEFKSSRQFYYYVGNSLQKTKKQKNIPDSIEDYVIEIRETLSKHDYLYTIYHIKSPENYAVLVFPDDDSHINDRKMLAKAFLRIKGTKLGAFTKNILKKQWGEKKFQEVFTS